MNRLLISILSSSLLLLASGGPIRAQDETSAEDEAPVQAEAPAPLGYKGWFLGGGLVGADFGDDLDRVDSGPGLTFSGGYQFDEVVSAEILAGYSVHDDVIADEDLFQFNLLAGAKFSVKGEKFRPYGVVGFSLNVIEVGDIDDLEDDEDFEEFEEIDGFGLYLGFGADIFVFRKHAINLGYRANFWEGKGDGPDLDIRSDLLTITYNYYLSR